MSIPGVQKLHGRRPSSRNDAWSGLRAPPSSPLDRRDLVPSACRPGSCTSSAACRRAAYAGAALGVVTAFLGASQPDRFAYGVEQRRAGSRSTGYAMPLTVRHGRNLQAHSR